MALLQKTENQMNKQNVARVEATGSCAMPLT